MSGKEYTNSGVEVRYPIDAIATDQARDIMDRLVPQWASAFLAKNRKYREVDNSLGAKGVFPDVWRKVGILKSRMWLGHGVVGEATREVIMDLIGHLFLMVYMMDTEAEQDALADAELLEGQGHALDRAADRSVAGYTFANPNATLLPALDIEPGTIKFDLLAPQYDPKKLVREQLEAAWHDGYVTADNGMDNDNPYAKELQERFDREEEAERTSHSPKVSRPEMTVSERLERDGGRH